MGMPRSGGKMYCNRPQPFTVVAKITAASDVEASGYTVTEGKDYVSAVTRTAEGKAKIALRQSFPRFDGFDLTTDELASTCTLENDSSSSGSDPHLDVRFQSIGTTPADTDPDSAVMIFRLHFGMTSNADSVL